MRVPARSSGGLISEQSVASVSSGSVRTASAPAAGGGGKTILVDNMREARRMLASSEFADAVVQTVNQNRARVGIARLVHMEKINNHVILPLLADWSRSVNLKLRWDSEVEPALRGDESRGRSGARPGRRFLFAGLAELWSNPRICANGLSRRSDSLPGFRGLTIMSGAFACPYMGVAVGLTGPRLARPYPIASTPWPWSVGDWVLLFSAETEQWAYDRVAGVGYHSLTLGSNYAWLGAGDLIYPVMFGWLEPGEQDMATYVHSDVEIRVHKRYPGSSDRCAGRRNDLVGVEDAARAGFAHRLV